MLFVEGGKDNISLSCGNTFKRPDDFKSKNFYYNFDNIKFINFLMEEIS